MFQQQSAGTVFAFVQVMLEFPLATASCLPSELL